MQVSGREAVSSYWQTAVSAQQSGKETVSRQEEGQLSGRETVSSYWQTAVSAQQSGKEAISYQ
jgi:hypothetical protein